MATASSPRPTRASSEIPATQQEQDTNADAKMTDDQKQAAWDTWAAANNGMFGSSRSVAAGKFLEFFPDANDAMSDPRFTKYWPQ